MGNTSREIVKDTLLFNNPSRVPCEIFYSNWAKNKYPQIINKIQNRFPNDIIVVDNQYKKSSKVKGNKNRIGKYIDEWSCEFVNIKDGMIGEVKKPLLKNLSEWKKINPPYELLPDNSNKFNNLVNNFCKNSNKFVRAKCIPRPWERYQLIRGTENALMDCVSEDENFFHLLNLIHKYYIKEFEIWARTAVDGMMFMDDWGSQNQMMISPKLWRTIFKPLYREYCEIAHSHGKFVFMHSDGYIMDIFEDLIEIGVDAINSQLFCMDIEEIGKRFKGKVTFWGEIDRQNILPSTNLEIGKNAIKKINKHLYDSKGGIINQFQFGLDTNPEMAIAILGEWNKMNN